MATGTPCFEKEGCTDIHFFEPDITFPIQHVHHKLPSLASTTSFSVNGKNYHWKGHNELVEDDTETVIAKFHPKWLEGPGHKIGTLELSQKEIQDIIVVTAVVVQERSDEHKLSVLPLVFVLLIDRLKGLASVRWKSELRGSKFYASVLM